MDNIRESVYFKDLESRFIKINKACAEKFGLDDPSDIIGKTDFDFLKMNMQDLHLMMSRRSLKLKSRFLIKLKWKFMQMMHLK